MLTRLSLVFVFLNYISMGNGDAQLIIGSNCKIPNTDTQRECKLLSNCSTAVEDIQNNKTKPNICGFSGLEPIVCCTAIPISYTSKRVEKCNEYAKSVYKAKQPILPLSTNESSKTITLDTCNLNSYPLLIGGPQARPGEFPHFALLGYNGTNTDPDDIVWLCGGSLVSSRFVLTAAHCLQSRANGPVKIVRFGNINNDEFRIDIVVEKTIHYPDFTYTKYYNDIALIKLMEKVDFSKYIRPICLPTSDQFSPKLIEAGWTFQSYLDSEKKQLLRRSVEVITNKECDTHFQPRNRKLHDGIIDTQICTSVDERKDICAGDMLQMHHNDTYCMYTLIGIASFGPSCSIQGQNVYIRVFKYSDWIEDIIWGSDGDE